MTDKASSRQSLVTTDPQNDQSGYLLIQHGGADLHQNRGQVVARLAVADLLQQQLAAVVDHLPDQRQTGLPKTNTRALEVSARMHKSANERLVKNDSICDRVSEPASEYVKLQTSR